MKNKDPWYPLLHEYQGTSYTSPHRGGQGDGGWMKGECLFLFYVSVSLMEVKLSYEPVRPSVSIDLMVSRSYDLYQLSGERIMGHPVVVGIRPLP